MHYLRWNGQPSVDFFTDSDFKDFKASLNLEMKRLQSEGTNSKRRQAVVQTEEEGYCGKKGSLELQHLSHYLMLYFALRSGKEHRQLRLKPCQIEMVEYLGERPFLRYTEKISKNRPGGLKG